MTTILDIIPYPKSVKAIDGEIKRERICYGISTASDKFLAAKEAFRSIVGRVHGIEMGEGDGIKLCEAGDLHAGEYRIKISDGVLIEAADKDGAFYALSTLIQLIEKDGDGITLPRAEIVDRPDCDYRTLMVDLARKWHPFEALLYYVDLCFLYKIKYLHLHFIDSQSYTLPSDKFPKMPTEDRHYTKEQIAELNEYARAKNVEIIPEMEVPGHAKSMVTAYPELFADTPDELGSSEEYSLFFNDVKSNIICVGKPGIMDTLKTLTEEIIGMFPYSRYLHIGGDEAAIGDWAKCRDCKAYMAEHGIDGPRPLYTHFIKKMTDMVLDMGKTPIVWEGFPREGNEEISRRVLVTAWESYYYLAPDLIEDGFTITNASWEPLYTVPAGHRVVTSGRWSPAEVLEWNIYTWKNWNKKTAAFEKPIVIEPTDKVLGATFCAWENDFDGEITPIRENLAAMSEKVWNINSEVSGGDFARSLKRLLSLAEKL